MLPESGKGAKMTLAIILNVILCGAVVTGVVAPVALAIRTQHRHQPALPAAARRLARARQHAARGARERRSDPIVWPAR
jgi:hypothetical protein